MPRPHAPRRRRRRVPPPRSRSRGRGSGRDPARGTSPARAGREPAGLEEPRGDLRECRLATAVRPLERDDLAAADGERRAAEHVRAAAVREIHAVQPDERRGAPARGAGSCALEPARVARSRSASQARASATGASRTIRPSSIMITRSAIASARSTRCSERTTAQRLLDRVEERLGAPGIELRRRFVEQEQLGSQRERRGETDALQLTARQLDRAPGREVRGAHFAERCVRPAARSARARRRGSRGRTPPRCRRASSRPGPRDPGRRMQLCPPARPARASACRARHLDPAGEASAVEVRHEPGERAQERRLAAPRRPEQCDDLARAGARVRRRAPPARRRDRRTTARRPSLEPCRHPNEDDRPASATWSIHVQPGAAPASRRRPNPRASIASARPVARSSDPATSGESSIA